MGAVSPIAISDFKTFFVRDFPYGDTSANVTDADITKAISEASILFNPALWDDLNDQKVAFEYLTAHCLVRALNSFGGINTPGKGVNSSGSSPINSKSVGPISVGFALSQQIVDKPALNQYLTTGYGQKYLELVMPRLMGNIATAYRDTLP